MVFKSFQFSKLNAFKSVNDDFCTYSCKDGTLWAGSTSNEDICDKLANVFCCIVDE